MVHGNRLLAANLASGLLLNLAFAPTSIGVLAWILMVPLLQAAESASPDLRTACGLAFGLGLALPGVWWLVPMLHTHLGTALPVALGAWLLVAGYMALYPTCFAWLAGYPSVARWRWLTWPALWVFLDDLRNQGFGGNPWLHIGVSQLDLPLAGFIPLLGATGIGAILVWLNLLLLHTLKTHGGRRRAALVAASALVLTGFALRGIHWSHPYAAPLRVALLNTAAPQDRKLDPRLQEHYLAGYLDRTRQLILDGAQLVVWPETASGQLRRDMRPHLEALREFAAAHEAEVLLGVLESDHHGRLHNSAILLQQASAPSYRKRHLVWFGEKIPHGLARWMQWAPGDPRYQAGIGPAVLYTDQAILGMGICWEGSFARDMVTASTQGAQLLFNLANDAWFTGTALPQRSANHARARALEFARPMLRAANAGPGFITDAKGRIRSMSNGDRPVNVRAEVQPRRGKTPFARLGPDAIQLGFGLMLLGGWIAGRRGGA